MTAEHIARPLSLPQRASIDEERLRVGLLEVDDAEHHRLELLLDVMGLVDRQPRQRAAVVEQLAEDEEQGERVDRADDQVVVGVLAVIEVEAPQPLPCRDQRHDLLDVGPLRVVAEVDEHAGALAKGLADQQGRAPIRNVRGVEGGLEELVLDKQLLLGRHRRVELARHATMRS